MIDIKGLTIITKCSLSFTKSRKLKMLWQLKKPSPIFSTLKKKWRFWHHKDAHIFQITLVKFYSWNMLHLKDINENVPSYGNHNQALIHSTIWQLQTTKLLCTSKRLDPFNSNSEFTSLERRFFKWNRKLNFENRTTPLSRK